MVWSSKYANELISMKNEHRSNGLRVKEGVGSRDFRGWPIKTNLAVTWPKSRRSLEMNDVYKWIFPCFSMDFLLETFNGISPFSKRRDISLRSVFRGKFHWKKHGNFRIEYLTAPWARNQIGPFKSSLQSAQPKRKKLSPLRAASIEGRNLPGTFRSSDPCPAANNQRCDRHCRPYWRCRWYLLGHE